MPGHVTPTANQIRTDLSSSLNVRRKLDLDGHVPPGGLSDAVVGDAVVRPSVLLLDAVDLQNVASVLEIAKLTLVIKQSGASGCTLAVQQGSRDYEVMGLNPTRRVAIFFIFPPLFHCL